MISTHSFELKREREKERTNERTIAHRQRTQNSIMIDYFKAANGPFFFLLSFFLAFNMHHQVDILFFFSLTAIIVQEGKEKFEKKSFFFLFTLLG